jgi:hypothetical protein
LLGPLVVLIGAQDGGGRLRMQEAEIKHGRIAMIASTFFAFEVLSSPPPHPRKRNLLSFRTSGYP